MIPPGKAQLTPENGNGESIPVYLLQPRSTKRKGFSQMYNDCLLDIAKKKLAGLDLSVLLVMISHMEYSNICRLSQTEIAQELETARDVISRACKRLEELQCIAVAEKIGNVKHYRVSPYLAVKCGAKQQNAIIDEWDKQFTTGKLTSLSKAREKRSQAV